MSDSPFDWRNNPSGIKIEQSKLHGRRLPSAYRRATADWLCNNQGTTVAQMGKDGVLVKKYPSISCAARDMGVSAQAISSCINGRTKTCAGFKWALCPRIGCE